LKKLLFIFFALYSIITAQSSYPDWAKGIVWYQIFPERFSNGNVMNDPEAEKVFNGRSAPAGYVIKDWGSDWFSPEHWKNDIKPDFTHRRYGGDLQGIISRLDYIKELGVGGIYLNPVFEAVSHHKYDGSSFHHIDVNFGADPTGDKKIMNAEKPLNPETWKFTTADSLFLKLLDEVHKRGIRVIIDGVFNHCGRDFWAFNDLISKGENSEFKDWFMVKKFDDPSTPENEFNYKGWWNIASLPEFNRNDSTLAPGPKDYIFNSTIKWMDPNGDGDPSDGIDGWRLDVAADVPAGFWKEWSACVKRINPQAIIVGELWETHPELIGPDKPFHSQMNYSFAYAVNEFFIWEKKKLSNAGFREKLEKFIKIYDKNTLLVLQNLVDSHDTERLASMLMNPDRDYDRDGSSGNDNYYAGIPSVSAREQQLLIAAFQICFPGSPMIYYGDEAGMWGADDPHCRKPMLWKDIVFDNEVISPESGFKSGFGSYPVKFVENLFESYKKLIALRVRYKALQTGDYRLIENLPEGYFAIERSLGDEKILAVFNSTRYYPEFSIIAPDQEKKYYDLWDESSPPVMGEIGLPDKLSFKIFRVAD